ncbi:hypothetical protein [Streptomyces sp. NPDC056632]|uniref:terpene synthase family protein n=1 Tax=Streptomyces sp. NPDC056632 TaxID=3345884 RepID=UPI0036A261CE
MSEAGEEHRHGPAEIDTYGLPFPPRINPHYQAILPRHIDWVREKQLVTQEALDYYQKCACPELAARVYPDAPAEAFEGLARFIGWTAFYDDQFDGPDGRDPARARERIQGCLEVMESHSAPPKVSHPLDRAFAEIWAGTVSARSDQWRERFKKHCRLYLFGYVYEASVRSQGKVQSLEEYDRHRNDEGGVPPSFDLIEAAGDFEVAPALVDAPEMAAMRDHAGHVLCLANDLASLAREATLQEVVGNRVLLLQHHQGMSRVQAVAAIEDLIRGHVSGFLTQASLLRQSALYTSATAPARRDAERFIQGMGDWMRGNLDWQARTARYHGGWQILDSQPSG